MCRSNRQFAEKYARAMSTATNVKNFLPRCTDAAGDTQYEAENCARELEHIDNYFNTFMASYEDAWDSNLQWGCDCDAGFYGADCSLRECPSNFDPLDPICEGLLSDTDDLKIPETSDDTLIILSTTDPDETAVSFGASYADYMSQFRDNNIFQNADGGTTIFRLNA